ncbi:MAG: ribokinase [Thainema sp.]
MTILVFGSLNMDLVARTPRLPIQGETIVGRNFKTLPGGKGANQAVAVARLGATARMYGRVGDDSFGRLLLGSLQQAGVESADVVQDVTSQTGVAVIAVDDAGQNHIIIVPGANIQVGEEDLDRLKSRLSVADALMMQLEIPLDAVRQAAHLARRADVPVILDPAPVHPDLSDDLLAEVDILTPNQIEASQLTGITVDSLETAEQAGKQLCDRGIKTVIVKLGPMGVVCVTENETFHSPAFDVEVVDTVAAGDAFNAGLVVALCENHSLAEAVRWGNAAAALAVTQPGAQPSMPDRASVKALLI